MLDADDLWLPEYLEVMGAALEDTPGAGLAYTDAWVLDDVTGRIRRRSAMSYQRPPKVVPDPHSFFRLLLERNFIYTSVTAPRSVLERVGGYDESLGTSEDWELWLRIVATGTAAVRPPGKLAIHRKHSASLTSDPRKIARSTCEIYRRFAHDSNADAEVRALAERQLGQWTKTLGDLEDPTLQAYLRRHAGAIKRRALRRWIWRRPPVAVERTLRAVEDGALAAA